MSGTEEYRDKSYRPDDCIDKFHGLDDGILFGPDRCRKILPEPSDCRSILSGSDDCRTTFHRPDVCRPTLK